MKLRTIFMTGLAVAAMSLWAGTAFAADPAPVVAPAEEVIIEEEEVDLTYQQQATLLVDTIIEDYTVRMAALQAIIDMRDDTIAGLGDTAKTLNANIKLLQAIMKAAQNVDKAIRPMMVALPEADQAQKDIKDAAIAVLDRVIVAVDKYNAAQ